MTPEGILLNLESCIIVLTLFFGLNLIKEFNVRSNLWLSLINLTLSCHFLNLFLLSNGINVPNFGLVFGLLYGPLLYYFIESHLIGADKDLGLQLIPSLVLAIWILVYYMLSINTSDVELQILRVLVFLHFIGYMIVSYQKSKKIKLGTLKYRSNKIIEERIGIVENTMIIISILYLIGLFEIILVFGENSTYLVYISIIACVLILLGLLKYMSRGLNYYNVVYSTPLSNEKFPELESDKYKSSSLSKKMAEQYVEELNELMLKEKPFTNFDLTLAQLAKMLNMPERYLSQVINEYFHQNFYDFINSKRIEEAQGELRDKSKRISEIMYDVGFVSRSSFNTSFKKYVGMTPSEFRRKTTNS